MVVVLVVGLAVVLLGGALLTARQVQVGMRDAVALASKTAVPRPRSARDWPELRVTAVQEAPGDDDILVIAKWPGRPGTFSSLVLRAEGSADRATRMLMDWREHDTPLSPMPWEARGIELRPRRSNRCLYAWILAETQFCEPDPAAA